MGDVNVLAVILILLLAPLNVHMVDVVDWQITDVGIGESTLPLTREGEVIPGEGE